MACCFEAEHWIIARIWYLAIDYLEQVIIFEDGSEKIIRGVKN